MTYHASNRRKVYLGEETPVTPHKRAIDEAIDAFCWLMTLIFLALIIML